ncbi:TPA: hypothetical protein IAB29_06625 [Candidatus Ventrenecus stercoripullorum]|nr:hypothetical protein [Candidatus Ventrenecus stercoripullorum]
MNKKQQELTIGTKYGCFTIIGDNKSYPKEPITDPCVIANLKKQNNIEQKIKDEELPKNFKVKEYYICKCQCGKEYFIRKDILLMKKPRYCSEECYTDVEFDKSKNYDIDFTNTIHESLNILECIDEKYEYDSYIKKTRKNRIKHIKIDKKYRCVCYMCNREHIFSALDFEIKNDEFGRNATKGYYSNAYCDCHKISSFQWRTIKIFEENNIKYKVEVSFPDLMGSTKLLRYDFAIYNSNGSIKYLVECQGKQHYEPVKEFGGSSQFEHQIENDKLKLNYADKRNIPLIKIPYTCNTYEKEVEFVKQNIII